MTSKARRNLGAGLSYLIDNIVGRNRGIVRIQSLSGILTCEWQSSGVKKKRRDLQFIYPGTLVEITLDADKIAAGELEAEDLQW